ncbi:MAG: hypothetical protein ACRC6V_01615 [Bacteroidales bacterium]
MLDCAQKGVIILPTLNKSGGIEMKEEVGEITANLLESFLLESYNES